MLPGSPDQALTLSWTKMASDVPSCLGDGDHLSSGHPTSPSSTSLGSTTCTDTPDTSLSENSPLSKRVKRTKPWHKYLEEMITPTIFKKVLLKVLPWDGAAAKPLMSYPPDVDIPVMVHKGKVYYLGVYWDVFRHDPPNSKWQADTLFEQLHHERNGIHINGDFFLSIGSLLEPADAASKGKKRLTNYVWALNISTNPVSLWLIFNYVVNNADPDEDADEDAEPQCPLSDIYYNMYNELHDLPYAHYKQEDPKGYLELGSKWDMLEVFHDVEKDWIPHEPKRVELDGARREHLGSTMRFYSLQRPPQEIFDRLQQHVEGS
ncbi:MAG: hypothetical protein Q9170_001512 [Blastenia crenularia]